MIFVLDNYDSFTYNLVQYLGELGEKVLQRDVELAAVQHNDLLLQPIAERTDRMEVLLDRVAAARRRHRDRPGDR